MSARRTAMRAWASLLLLAVGARAASAQDDVPAAFATLMTRAGTLVKEGTCGRKREAHTLARAAVVLAATRADLATRRSDADAFLRGLVAPLRDCDEADGVLAVASGSIFPGRKVVGGGGRCAKCARLPTDVIGFLLSDPAERDLLLGVGGAAFQKRIDDYRRLEPDAVSEAETLRALGATVRDAERLRAGLTVTPSRSPELRDRLTLPNLKRP